MPYCTRTDPGIHTFSLHTLSTPRNVAHALASLERLADGLAAGRNNATIPPDASDAFPPTLLLHHASAALRAALRADSDPGLLAPPHLPLEHYAATLLPLLLPVLLPLLVGLGKERRRLREKRAGGGGGKGRKQG